MVGSDGEIDDEEMKMLMSLCHSYPKLKNTIDLEKVPEEIKKVFNRMAEAINSDGSVESILKEFLTISDDTLRKQCLMIAMEGALANGEVNQEEENFLDNFRQMLNIDEQWAKQMSDIIIIRYQ